MLTFAYNVAKRLQVEGLWENFSVEGFVEILVDQ